MTVWLILMQILPTQSLLLSTAITSEAGFVNMKIRTLEIVNQTVTVLHMVNPKDFMNIVEDIELNMKNMQIPPNGLIEKQIQILKSRIRSITPIKKIFRKKRGLLNIVGNAQKFLFGTMDDGDRNDILSHLDVITKNSHNAVEGLNKQIVINEHFQDSINLLKATIISDRNLTEAAFSELKSKNNKLAKQLLLSDISSKLRFIEDRVDQIQNSVASSKNHVLHPNVLTPDEIHDYNIDFYKLKLTKLDILYYKDDLLVIAIKIPVNFITTDLKLILPLPNSKFLEIDSEREFFITIGNVTYEYEENKSLKYLQRSSSCTLHSNCKFRYNDEFSVVAIDEETVVVKNAKNKQLIQNCDDRLIVLNGNYVLSFYDCQIKIDYNVYINRNEILFDKFIYDNDKTYNFTENTYLNFKKLKNDTFQNLNQIKELEWHRSVSYGINLFVIIFVSIALLVFILLLRKNKIKIKINEAPPQIREVIQKYEENK